MSIRLLVGDCRDTLRTLSDGGVQTCVTSPPYFGLRDYGMDGQIGLEQTPDEFVAHLVAVFREVRRVLADDGTLWLNLGDSYSGGGRGGNPGNSKYQKQRTNAGSISVRDVKRSPFKDKDLIGIPWMVAFALRADGWWLRQDIIWSKPNPMPESVRDRCTKAHEYLFLLSKGPRYYYDADAIAEEAESDDNRRPFAPGQVDSRGNGHARGGGGQRTNGLRPAGMRNKRSVWEVATQPFKEAHFATFPPSLIEPCILAGSRPGDTVLDPFGGAGTTGLVADRFQRNAILCELNPVYAEIAQRRITADSPLFAEVAA